MHFFLNISLVFLGACCLALPSSAAAADALPPTLKPEPHHRDPYDWDARHEAVKKETGKSGRNTS